MQGEEKMRNISKPLAFITLRCNFNEIKASFSLEQTDLTLSGL